MKRVLLTSLLASSTMMITGCATQDWAENKISEAKQEAEVKFKKQNKSLSADIDRLLQENKEYLGLLKEYANESKSIKNNLASLKQELKKLDDIIKKTKVDLTKEVKQYYEDGDKQLYNKITAEQQKHIDALKVEMVKVEQADIQSKKLNDIIDKIMKAYENEK